LRNLQEEKLHEKLDEMPAACYHKGGSGGIDITFVDDLHSILSVKTPQQCSS
jgi:hypothetical protein